MCAAQGGNRCRSENVVMGMRGWLQLAAISALVTAAMACDVSTFATPSSTPAEFRTVAPSGTGSTPRLATADEQRTVVQALERSGARINSVIPSKFDWLFGNTSSTSAVFQGTLAGQDFWVDVHFLATPVDNLTACSSRGSSGETEFTVSVNGQPQVAGQGRITGSLAGTGPMYFAGTERLFLMTPHAHALDALRRSLAVTPPRC
jgi:hypothetical protein